MTLRSTLSPDEFVTRAKAEQPAACLAAIIRKRISAAAPPSAVDTGAPIQVSGMLASADGVSLQIVNPIDGRTYRLALQEIGEQV